MINFKEKVDNDKEKIYIYRSLLYCDDIHVCAMS